jgi:hypothetical protein
MDRDGSAERSLIRTVPIAVLIHSNSLRVKRQRIYGIGTADKTAMGESREPALPHRSADKLLGDDYTSFCVLFSLRSSVMNQ